MLDWILASIPASALAWAGASLARVHELATLHGGDLVEGPLAALNTACLVCMAADKAAAVLRLRRVPEWVCLALSLAGGGPALLVARSLLRHKTRRWAFALAGWGGSLSALVWLSALP